MRLGLHTSTILQYYVNWCADMPQTDEERMRANLHCVGDFFTTISEGTVGTLSVHYSETQQHAHP